MSISIVTQEDNMQMMARYPDGFFDLAVVDPPYGIQINMNMWRKNGKKKAHAKKKWDNDIIVIRNSDKSITEIAKIYNVSIATISRIKSNHIYKNIL